jgi:hypothetical protein
MNPNELLFLIKSNILVGIPLFYTLAVLFGAPFFSKCKETLLLAGILSICVILPLAKASAADLEILHEFAGLRLIFFNNFWENSPKFMNFW